MNRRLLVLFLIIILGFSLIVPYYVAKESRNYYSIVSSRQNQISYVFHEPFNITSDSDFEIQGWPGNGSYSNPFLIENLNITTSQSACIWVSNTTSHFIIQNCYFASPVNEFGSHQPVFPITMTNVSNSIIRGNKIIDSKCGISGYSLFNCSISDNQFNVSWSAIEIRLSNFTTILNNSQKFDSCYYGLNIISCRNCTISHNVFMHILSTGIYTQMSYNTSLIYNTLVSSISGNPFSWCGISIVYGAFCIVRQNEISNFVMRGIQIFGNNHLVANNNITSNEIGILISANTSNVRNNMLVNNFNAIEIINSNHTKIYTNTIQGESGRYGSGIVIHGGSSCDIYSNVISHIGYGIILQGATGFNISSNNVFDNRYGFAFSWSGYDYPEVADGPSADCNINNNSFNGGGLFSSIPKYPQWDFSTIQFLGNIVNGRPIGFYAYLNGAEIDGNDYGQLLLVSCTSTRIIGGNFYDISSDFGEGIYYDPGQASAINLLNCTNCTLENVRYRNNTIGVIIQDSSKCEISGGFGSFNSWVGVILWHSAGIFINDVYFTENRKGLGTEWSYDCRIFNCLSWANEEAFILVNSPNCTLYRNTIFQNADAILFAGADDSIIRRNAIYENSRGILLNSSSGCLVTQNNVNNNAGVGICLDLTSHRNTIFNNVLTNNSPNAICDGTSNHWDNQIDTGNVWSDYSGEGPYIIDEDDQDNFPIVNRTIPSHTIPTESWINELVLFSIAGGLIGIVAVIIIIVEKRRVIIID
ncbi:MAG: NosD domain-containing protein [Candidatus Thorarchaeota archaeon]